MVIFYFPHLFLRLLIEFFCKKELSFLPYIYLLNYSFISVWNQENYFWGGYNLNTIIILLLKLFALLDWLLCPFNMHALPFFSLFSFCTETKLSSFTRHSMLVVYFPCPKLYSQQILQGALVSFFGGWNLETKIWL